MNTEMEFSKAPGETDLTGSPNFNVVIAYKDLTAGKRAMRVLADLGKGVGDDIEFRPFLWSFDLLTDLNWRDVAASDAIKADMLIIATSDTNSLPPAVERWVETILSRKRGTDTAVVALFGTEENPDETGSPRLEIIQTATHRAGLDFFAPVARHELDETMSWIHRRAEMVTPLLDGILHQHHPPPHWGINE